MKRMLLGVLAVVCLALVLFHAQQPLLYAAENISSEGEVDLSVAEPMDPKKGEAVLPLLQDLLGQGEHVVLSVKVKDWESAQRELDEYAEMTRSMDNLVVSLDLSETDLDEFRQKSRENQGALETLVNGTERLDHLKELEITYRDSDDPSRYYSVVYEGETLKKHLDESYTTYASGSRGLAEIGERYEAETEGTKRSVETFREVVEETTGFEQGPGEPGSQISIALDPAEAAYGEVVRWHGTLTSQEAGAALKTYLDSSLYASGTTGEGGDYGFSYEVGKIRAGTHLVYVSSGRLVSDLVSFTVGPSPSRLSLQATVEGERGVCQGRLTCGDLGVAGAGVHLIADGEVVATGVTGDEGEYEIETVLAPGEHLLQAEFTGEGFPLEHSASEKVTLRVSPSLLSSQTLLTAGGALAVGVLAGAVFLRWSRRGRRQDEEEREIILPVETVVGDDEEEEEEEIPEAPAPATPEEAAGRLWGDLARSAGTKAQTPRELAEALKESPAAESVRAFVRLYERVRYAGDRCTWDEVRTLEGLLKEIKDSRVP
ncbi:hypothetical protein J2129_000007 [Methanofollis sp. W23]|uniref:DUF4129 domain-containing protein n=1 Tax=Methanofollis sp. W23 TaxID=2817849 RepID=UPI001AE155A6|nr:DUF4129 domain-containing protein [Methanofollis sp. W23]MBP2144553.1 hypothetical protein [Methanofollis sp. W23]